MPGEPTFTGRDMLTIKRKIHMLNWKKKRTPIPRKKLAHEVAKKVHRYLTLMAVRPYSDKHFLVPHKRTQRITPDGSAEDRFRIGQGFMHIDNMYLVSLAWVSKGSFQPEIFVEVPPKPRVRADEDRDLTNHASIPSHVVV